MFKVFTRKTSAAVVSLALGTALVAVPAANAETPDSATEVNKVDVSLPLACNLKVKSKSTYFNSVYNSADDKYKDFKLQLPVEAPASVEPGAEFDYTILPAELGIPAKVSFISVDQVTQLNLWIDLPKNAEVKDIVTEGDASKLSITQEDGRLHIKGKDGANVEDWTEARMDDDWKLGGLRAKKEGNKFVVDTPKVILKMKVKDDAKVGDKIALKIDETDANSFSPLLFTQLYAKAIGHGAFIRCGLSEYVPATADNKSTPFPAVEIKEVTPEDVDVTAKVKLLDEEGNPFKEGETVQLLVNDGPRQFTVEADGFITITDTQKPGEEKKSVKVAFEGGEPVSVELNAAADASQAEAKTLQKPKAPESQPGNESSSADEVADLVFSMPKIWGSILAAIIALPVLGLLAKAVIDFFGHTRF